MKLIQINIIAHHGREEFSNFVIKYLAKIKEENKKKIRVVIWASSSHGQWDDVKNFLKSNGIETKKVFPGGTYIEKIKMSVSSDTRYSCSLDDDILINNYLWDYMIENIEILDNNKNLFLAPLISNGIPSVDMFIEDFMNEDEKNIMHDLFKNKKIDNMWGATYESLNNFTIHSEKWNSDDFYKAVYKIDHFYKGIHPVRPSFEAQMKIAQIVMGDFQKFEENGNFYLEKVNKPYFCNSFYFIRTDIWRKIIGDPSLFKDPFDEVPMNLYKDKHDLNMVFVRNGFCIHMAYNTLGAKGQNDIQNFYIDKLKKTVI